MSVAVTYRPEQLAQSARELDLQMVVLFGSRATGRALHQESDLDIAVLDRRLFSPARWGEVYMALSEVFRPYELDLVFFSTIDALFRLEIMRQGILLYGDRDTFDTYRIFAYRDFVDTGELRRLEGILFRKKMAFIRRCLHGQ